MASGRPPLSISITDFRKIGGTLYFWPILLSRLSHWSGSALLLEMTGVCGTATRFPAATLFVDRGADCDRLGAPLRASVWLEGTWKLAVDVPPESKLAPRLRAIAPASNNETCAC